MGLPCFVAVAGVRRAVRAGADVVLLDAKFPFRFSYDMRSARNWLRRTLPALSRKGASTNSIVRGRL